MMKNQRVHIVIIVFVLSFLWSCRDTKDGELIPPISPEEMGMVLLELQYAEHKSIGLFPDSIRGPKQMDRNFDSLALFYQEVFERNDLSFEEFKEHLNWYKHHAQFLDLALKHAKEVLEENREKAPESDAEEEDKVIEMEDATMSKGLRSILKPDEEEERKFEEVKFKEVNIEE